MLQAAYENTATISTSEYSLPNNSTTLTPLTLSGVFQGFIDFSAMLAGDKYTIKVKDKVVQSGTQRTLYTAYLDGLQVAPFVIPAFCLMHGWDITVQRTAGTDRSIGWSLRQVA